MTFRCVNFLITDFAIAYVGLIYRKLYMLGFNKESAAKPKNVWKTSTVLPGRSPIPPSSSWQFRIKLSNAFWSIQSNLFNMQKVE